MKYFWLIYRLEKIVLSIWVFSGFFCTYLFLASSQVSSDSKKTNLAVLLNYELLGQGPFSLNPQYLNPQTPKVLDSLFAVIGSKLKFADGYIHVGTDEQHLQSMKYGEYTQLKFNSESGENLSNWFLKPLKIDQDILFFEAKCQENDPIVISLPINKNSHLIDSGTFDYDVAVELLKNAAYLGPDLLSQSYGFNNTSDDKHRVMVADKQIFNLLPEQDLFFDKKWQEDEASWEYRARLEIDHDTPSFTITNKTGFKEIKIELKKNQPENFPYQNYIPKMAKSYSDMSFSCFIGKQKFILKENDWIARTDNFFHILRSKSEILSLLRFQKVGPLVVIDQVLKGKDSSLIRGKIFPPLRMSVYPFEIEAPLSNPEKPMRMKSTKGVKKVK